MKNKKIGIIAAIITLGLITTYSISSYVGMKQYYEYSEENYKYTMDTLYERNAMIISNKDILIDNIPNIKKNVNEVENLVDNEKNGMDINEGIALSNKIEENVTTIINEYKQNNTAKSNKQLNTVMEEIILLDQSGHDNQSIFNQSVNDKRTGYNGLINKNILTKQVAKITKMDKINEFLSE